MYGEVKEPINCKCAFCGKEFLTKKASTKYCSFECRKERKKQQDKYCKAHQKKRDYSKPKPKEEPKRTYTSIEDIVLAADKCGMSYGRYVAMRCGA